MMTGGDGYPNVRTSAATQDILDQDVADYFATLPGSQVTPVIQHRIHCFDPNPGAGEQLPDELAVARAGSDRARSPRSPTARCSCWPPFRGRPAVMTASRG